VQITIINTPPVLDGILASEITIFDGLTGTLNYHATDPENSNLLEIRYEGTLPPPWITLTPAGLFEASPEILHNDTLYVVIEAFDGAIVSTPWTIKVIVIYDPPVPSDTLVDQKVKVGSTLLYTTPAKNIVRQHDAIVLSPGIVYFGSTTGDTFKF
jgi:hypothetical protein